MTYRVFQLQFSRFANQLIRFSCGINIIIRYLLSKTTISNTLAATRFNSIFSKKDDHLSLHISLKDLRLINPATLRGPAIWSAKEREIGNTFL